MIRVFLRHEVVDYDTWRRHYDSFDAERREMGVVSDAVFRNQEDEHEITVTHDFPSMAEAERFVSPRTLRRATKADPAPASDPSVWFAEL